jgi:DNA-binding IclR family transcriptional regulator
MNKPLKTQILDYLQQEARFVTLVELLEHTNVEEARLRLWLTWLVRFGKVFEVKPEVYSFITPVEIVTRSR